MKQGSQSETAGETHPLGKEVFKSYRILIVDDESSIRSLLGMILKENNPYEIVSAENGQKALEILDKDKSIDIVLTDIQMPVMNGVELLRRIKQLDPMLPVIMITGFPTIDIAIHCMKEGASDFVTKPFKYDHVEFIVKKVIQERELLLENSKLKEELAHAKEIERLNRQLSEKIRELTVLSSVSESLFGLFNTVDQVLDKTLEIVADSLECERISILFFDKSSRTLQIKAARGLGHEIIEKTRIRVGEGIAGKVFQKGQSLLVRDVDKELSENSREGKWLYRSRSLISVPLFLQGEPMGIINATDKIADLPFSRDDLVILENIAKKVSLNIENVELYESVYKNLIETLLALVKTLEAKDSYTQKHSERVTFYAIETAKALGCHEDLLEALRFSGHLHDIGKVGVRDTVLLKQGRLTDLEFEEIKRHPVIGEEIVKHLELLKEERAIIRSHHERWDGKGYPDGLKELEIPFLARILTVADAYDAMTSSRPYRKALSHEVAMEELERHKWRQFDGEVVDAFSSIIRSARETLQTSGIVLSNLNDFVRFVRSRLRLHRF